MRFPIAKWANCSDASFDASSRNRAIRKSALEIPLSPWADAAIGRLAQATGSATIAQLDGATLLGERAMLAGMRITGRISAGGGCRLFEAANGDVAINLARPSDREMLPALFESERLDPDDQDEIAAHVARREAGALVGRGRMMGLAIAHVDESRPRGDGGAALVSTDVPARPGDRPPRVIDLSALWAGPLASHLLWLAGAEVLKVESRTRPDAMREGDGEFHALLNQGKSSIALDLADPGGRDALLALIAASDIVIDAARPRALTQLGIDATALARATPGLVWISITGHGAVGESGNWVGFGDDCAVAGGLSAALRAAGGRVGFVGDAIADPLTGLSAAELAWDAWTKGRGGRFTLSMSQIVAHCLEQAKRNDRGGLAASLNAWSYAEGAAFPDVRRRPIGECPRFGEQTREWLARVGRC